jgi:hypothetical protein
MLDRTVIYFDGDFFEKDLSTAAPELIQRERLTGQGLGVYDHMSRTTSKSIS